jgi:hypothetical protein
VIDWDAYRRNYRSLSDADQATFYARVHDLYPEQRHGNVDAVRRFLSEHAPDTVVEMGGWDGWLKREEGHSVPEWMGLEVCPTFGDASFRWWRGKAARHVDGEAFVALHTIEHLDNEDARELLTTIKPAAMLLEMPIEENGQTWHGYSGTHVLTAGWVEVESWLAAAGYERAWTEGMARAYVRKGAQ